MLKRIPRAIMAVLVIFIGSIVLPIATNLVTGGTPPKPLKPYSHFYWPIIAASFLILAIYTIQEVIKRPAAPSVNTTPHPSNRRKALEEIQANINSRLASSLSRLAKLTLNMSDASDLIAKPEHLIVQSSTELASVSSAPRSDIMMTFSDYDESILILGAPGSGKSTTLLDLAQQLQDRARAQENAALPIVIDLSRWAAHIILPAAPSHRSSPSQQSATAGNRPVQSRRILNSRRQAVKPEGGLGRDLEFSEWLIREMQRQYSIPRRVGEVWLRDRKVLLLLDGLDEMSAPAREECVKTINRFLDTFNMPGIAITCRLQDYQGIASKLTVQGAVRIQPLTREQISQYFEAAGDRLSGVRSALGADRTLWELLDSPLMLSIMAIAYHDREIDTSQLGSTILERRNKLTAAYVTEVLSRRQAPISPFSVRETKRWMAIIGHAASIGNMMPLGQYPPGVAMQWSYSAPETAVRLLLSAFFPWLVGIVCVAGVVVPVGLAFGPTVSMLAVAPAMLFQLSYLLLTKPISQPNGRKDITYSRIRRNGLQVGTVAGLACLGISTALRNIVIPSAILRSLIAAGVLVVGVRLAYRLEDVIRPSLIELSYWLAIIVGGAVTYGVYTWHPNSNELSWFFVIGICSALAFVVIGRQVFKLIDQGADVRFVQRRVDWASAIAPVALGLLGIVIVGIVRKPAEVQPVVAIVGIVSGIIYALIVRPVVTLGIGFIVSPASFVMSCMGMLPFRLRKFLYYAHDRSLLYRRDRDFVFIHAIFQDYFVQLYHQLSAALAHSSYRRQSTAKSAPRPRDG